MYKIFADDTLIYDSTIEDYKIGKGEITLETNKSGSFVFSLYPDHFYYDNFEHMKTVIIVYKSNRIIFRGRVINEKVDYWNNKTLTCEGELGFLQDSIARPWSYSHVITTPFTKFINAHNSAVDEFKRFKIGEISTKKALMTSSDSFETTFDVFKNYFYESDMGGYILITHGEDGTEKIPTIHYLDQCPKTSTQTIEFGQNLKDYIKTVKSDTIATAIVPVGGVVNGEKLTIETVIDGKLCDYVRDESAVAKYGLIFKSVEWSDITNAGNLQYYAKEYLKSIIEPSISIELTAFDLHLLDRSIESYNVNEYIRVVSKPHNFDGLFLCNKQTIDLLRPENDAISLGGTMSTLSGTNSKLSRSISKITRVESRINTVNSRVSTVSTIANTNSKKIEDILKRLEALENGGTT